MPNTTNLVNPPEIKIDGAPIPDLDHDALIDLHVSTELGVPAEATLRLSDDDFALVDGSRYVVGKQLEIRFDDESGNPVTVFKGEVVGVGVDQEHGAAVRCVLTVTALDKSHRLSHETKVRTFQKMKYSEVVSQIAGEHGLRADVEDSTIKFDYLIQTTTNHAFIQELAFRSGFQWSVTDDKLSFKKRVHGAPVATLEYGADLRRVRARYTATSEVTGVTVRAWDPANKAALVGTKRLSELRNGGAHGGTSQLGETGRSKARPFANGVAASALVAVNQDEATQLAGALGARMATADVSVRCECFGHPKIQAGVSVEIKKAGTRVSGTYYVTAAEHHFGRGSDFVTTFSTAPVDSSLVDMVGGSDRATPFGRFGLAIGIVTNNNDPDGLGRVRVKFPALSDEQESWWARVVTPGGGSSAGLMFMPQIDDEVLVGFESGDMRRPFVLGGLWGGRFKPPSATDQFLANNKVVEWGVKTLNGTTFALRSGTSDADKHYKVALPDGTTHYMGSDKTEIIAQNKSIELKSGQASIKITDSGDIEIKGTNIKINATQNITVEGLQIGAKANTTFKAEGGASMELKGGGSAKLEASGIAEVKGGAMVKIQ